MLRWRRRDVRGRGAQCDARRLEREPEIRGERRDATVAASDLAIHAAQRCEVEDSAATVKAPQHSLAVRPCAFDRACFSQDRATSGFLEQRTLVNTANSDPNAVPPRR